MTAVYFNQNPDRPEEFDDEPSSRGRVPPNENLTYGLALLVVAILMAAGDVASHWTVASRPTAAQPQDCTPIVDSETRLTCYDNVFHHAPPEPAKGALAPLRIRS